MKRSRKRVAAMIGLLMAGVVVGTTTSGLLQELPLNGGDLFSALILAPFLMTLGLPILFQFYSAVWGVVAVSGLIITVVTFALGRDGLGRRPLYGVFGGTVLWSLGNMPIFYAFMSV